MSDIERIPDSHSPIEGSNYNLALVLSADPQSEPEGGGFYPRSDPWTILRGSAVECEAAFSSYDLRVLDASINLDAFRA